MGIRRGFRRAVKREAWGEGRGMEVPLGGTATAVKLS